MIIGEHITLNAGKHPAKAAVVFRDQRITYAELELRVNRLARHLLAMGVQPGDRVAYMLHNGNACVELFHAAVRIGAIAVPVSFRLVAPEVKWLLDHVSPKVFVYAEACAGEVDGIRGSCAAVGHWVRSGANAPAAQVHYETLMADGDGSAVAVPASRADETALLMFTGGTTGEPKAAVHTHRSLYFVLFGSALANRTVDETETALIQAPMFHIAGLTISGRTMLVGGTLVLVESSEPQDLLRTIERERATFLMLLPPTSYTRLLDVPGLAGFDTSSVQKIVTAAGAFPKAVMLRLFDAFPNASIYFGYGLSESPLACTLVITRAMMESDAPAVRSIGRALPMVDLRVVDETGKDVPPGQVGEAVVRGPHLMQGYYRQPALTAAALRGGWMHTGDLLRRDAEGFFYFEGRSKDMIKTGGENVFAAEVERVLMAHPAVEICAVLGVPDEVLQEAVAAVVKLRSGHAATADDLVAHCRQHLASYKKPRHVLFVDQFPISDAGKVQKFKLRDLVLRSQA